MITLFWTYSDVTSQPQPQNMTSSGSTVLVIAALITAVCSGGGVAALVQWLANRGKSSAEEAEIWTRASINRLKAMHDEMASLETRLRSLNEELEVERRARLDTVRQLEAAIGLLERHSIDYRGIVSSN